MDDRPIVEPATRAEWRAWLSEHHATERGAWVVYAKRRHAAPGALDYEAIVLEALCFGWIDSTAGRVDEERTRLYVAPRKRGSIWAATNKARLELLEAAGLMAAAGRAVVDLAKADGSWTTLDRAEAGTEPPDLVEALAALDGARANWTAFPASTRKMAIGWIDVAKRPATRAARVEAVARAAAANERTMPPRPVAGDRGA
jgi:uncharacterized protein YdeI (YjbR/CyaY-like superfamily)